MDCTLENNLDRCPCSYDPCSRKGKCCECVQYHRQMQQLPGCFFPPELEHTYDRSYKRFKEWLDSHED